MVICKYYLQGTCRFGNTCKNEHSYNENPQSVLLKKPDIDVNVLTKNVSGDMLKAEKGNQWPLTCYGPFQAKPCFPGFEDKSFEEVRLGFHEAQQNGTLDQYKQGLNQLLQEAQLKIQALKNPTQEAANLLKNIYNNTQNTFQNSNTVFGNNQTNYSNSIFGNAAQSSQNIFANAAPTNLQSNSIFANANKSVFGGSAFGNVAPNQNIFAQNMGNTNFTAPRNQTVFGAPPPNQNIFVSSANNPNVFTSSAPTQSIFGSAAPSQNIFANAAQNVFASTANQNLTNTPLSQHVFTSAAPTQNVFASAANVFTSTASPNVFTSAAPSQNVFTSAAPSQNVFTSAAPSQNVFATTPNVFTSSAQNVFTSAANQAITSSSGQNVFTGTSSIFGNPQNPVQNQSIFASSPNPANFGTNLFANPSSNSPFGANTNTTNVFQQANTALSQNSIFGGAGQAHNANIFGNKPQNAQPLAKVDDAMVYSKVGDLTSDEINQFESRCFDFGKIPIRPPPLEMC